VLQTATAAAARLHRCRLPPSVLLLAAGPATGPAGVQLTASGRCLLPLPLLLHAHACCCCCSLAGGLVRLWQVLGIELAGRPPHGHGVSPLLLACRTRRQQQTIEHSAGAQCERVGAWGGRKWQPQQSNASPHALLSRRK
jgi:hypothetical protein